MEVHVVDLTEPALVEELKLTLEEAGASGSARASPSGSPASTAS